MSPTETKSAVQPRYDFLDGIRALLALYVVLHHIWRTMMLSHPGQTSPFFRFLSYGHYSVCFFILLSGFCLTLPLLKSDLRFKNGIGHFLKRRAWRILPPYYFALAGSLLLIAAFISAKTNGAWDVCVPVTVSSVVTHLFLVHNFFVHDMVKINHVFWSIAIEWQIYFVFPLLLLIWRRLGGAITTVAAMVVSLGVERLINHSVGAYPYVHFIGLFAIGVFAAHVSFSKDQAGSFYRTLPWGWLVLVTGAVSGGLIYLNWEKVADEVFGAFGMSLLIFLSLYPEGRLRRFLDLGPLVFVGTFAYSLYLIHAPLVQILQVYVFEPLRLSPNVTCVVFLLVGTPLIVLAAYAFFLCCERPFLQKGQHVFVHRK